MHFYFDYIYYRITQWKFKSQGSTSATALGLISVMQAFLIELAITPVFKYLLNKDTLAIHSRQLGWLGGLIVILLLILNYKKYNGKYEEYLTYWKDENASKRFVKGILVIISLVLPIIAYGLINTHWHK